MQTKVINIEDFQIEVGAKHKRKLQKEFKRTAQGVRDALAYRNNSKVAQAIRKRAKELLQQEITKVETIKVEEK